MNNKSKSIKLNALLNGIRYILNFIFPLITFPYVSRVLSVEGLGKYNFSSSIISYFMLIAALGIDRYAIREGAKFRDNKIKMSTFASEVFTINIISTIISYALLAVCLFTISKLYSYTACILIFSLQIFFTTIGTEWLYVIYEEYSYITIRSIAFKIISIIGLFVFVRTVDDYLQYAAITVFATVGSNVLNFLHAKKYCNIKLTLKFDWKSMLQPILIMFATNIAVQIYVNSDVTMLGFLKNDYTVGIYSVSTKIYLMVKNVLTAILTVSVPRFSLYAGKGDKNQYNILLSKLLNTITVIVFPVMVGLIIVSRYVILIISGNNYEPATSSLRILCIAIIFSIFSTIFNQCVLIPYKREKTVLKSSIISAALNIGLNFILIPLMNENGAAITTLLAEFTMALLNYQASRDLTKKAFSQTDTFKNIVSVVLGLVALCGVCFAINITIDNYIIKFVFEFVFGAIAYFITLLLLKNKVALSFINEISTLRSRRR